MWTGDRQPLLGAATWGPTQACCIHTPQVLAPASLCGLLFPNKASRALHAHIDFMETTKAALSPVSYERLLHTLIGREHVTAVSPCTCGARLF